MPSKVLKKNNEHAFNKPQNMILAVSRDFSKKGKVKVTYEDNTDSTEDAGYYGRTMNDITITKDSKAGKIIKAKNVGSTEIEIQYS